MGLILNYAALLALASAVMAQECPIFYEGRIPKGSKPTLFDDKKASPYNTEFVKGKNLTFSELIKIPDVKPSLFDAKGGQEAFEITISDKSIFAPSPDNVQNGFRRAESQFKDNNGKDDSTVGIKTLHWSMRKDPERPLDKFSEYQFVFLEDASFSTNQVVLKTGTISPPTGLDPDTLILFGNVNSPTVPQLFDVPFTADVWHNFAVTMDFEKQTTTVYYSTDDKPLELVSDKVDNDVSGQGQWHMGVLKKGQGGKDTPRDAFQKAGIDEGIIYGSIWLEDSVGGCVSLDPAKGNSSTSSSTASNGKSQK